MNWSDERYVRVYTRDTADLMAIGWEGRLVWYELLRKLDRAGLLDTGGDVAALPELLRVPADVFERGFPKLSARGMVRVLEKQVFVPNFYEAQETKQSDKARQRESRNTRLELARAQGLGDADARAAARPDYYPVTNRDQPSQNVTIGHDWSHAVTPGHSVPCLAVPSRAVLRSDVAGAAAPCDPPGNPLADGSSLPVARPAKPKAAKPEPSAAALELSAYLGGAIRTHTPGFSAPDATSKGWARDIDLAMRIDGRSAEQLRTVIDEAHRSADPFWRSNLLSGKKLREKFDQLWIKAQQHSAFRASGRRGLQTEDILLRAQMAEARAKGEA